MNIQEKIKEIKKEIETAKEQIKIHPNKSTKEALARYHLEPAEAKLQAYQECLEMLKPELSDEEIIEKVLEEQLKEIYEGYDISDRELKAECIINVEETIENSCKKAIQMAKGRKGE